MAQQRQLEGAENAIACRQLKRLPSRTGKPEAVMSSRLVPTSREGVLARLEDQEPQPHKTPIWWLATCTQLRRGRDRGFKSVDFLRGTSPSCQHGCVTAQKAEAIEVLARRQAGICPYHRNLGLAA